MDKENGDNVIQAATTKPQGVKDSKQMFATLSLILLLLLFAN